MKKIFSVALAATLLAAGCQKTEIINRVGDAIGFNAELSKLTKASDAANEGMLNLQQQNFKVWAYTAYEDATNGIEPGKVYDNMEALPVTYSNNAWGTTLRYYWPGENRSLDFFAVSTGATYAVEGQEAGENTPAVEGISVVITGMGDANLGGRTLKVNDYTVVNTNPNDDLMVAEFVRQHQQQNGKNVDLKFKHALSRVIFKFKTKAPSNENEIAPEVVINSLSVADLSVSGDLTVTEKTAAAAGTEDSDGTRAQVDLEWALDEAVANFADDYDGALTLTTAAQDFTTWLVMPQTLAGKKVTIDYTIDGRGFQTAFLLGTDTVTSWGINQSITYTVTLAPNVITFVPSVEDWEVVNDESMTN